MTVDYLPSAPATRSGLIERATAVLDTFLDGPEWMSLDDISLLAAIPRSTTFRILRQLVTFNWLEHTERGYRLGARFRRYSARSTDTDDLRAAASEALTELNLASGGVAHLGILDGSSVSYLDRVGGAVSDTIPSRVGARLPATETVCGRVLLAALTPEQVDAVIASGPLDGDLVHSLPAERVHHALSRIRQRNGIAFQSAERCRLGITAIAAPIVVSTGTVAAISVSVRRPAEFAHLAPLVVRAARRTSQLLAGQHRVAQAI